MIERRFPLSLRPLIYKCNTFMEEDDSYDSVTVIIVPVKFSDYGNYWTVKWSCNRGESCKNESCVYAVRRQREGPNR
ncbi:MAG: hypothetical protein QXJ82_04825 [Nitrososphaerota archaeon]